MPQTESASEGGLNLAFVLDDEPKVKAHICNILRRGGIDARGFVKAEKFLSAIRQCNPDLVILDLALGNTDAIEVIRRLEILKFMGRVLLVSGCDDTTLSEIEQIGQNRSLFMLRSLRKPFGIDDIKERLATSSVLRDSVSSREIESADFERSGARPRREQVSLIEALRKNWLEVWYQPKINLKSRMVCGAEALIRARHPDNGLIEPKELLPPVGDPLYKPLSLFVLRRTMQAWAAFADKGRLLKLSVNVPASILTTPGFVDIVRLAPSAQSKPRQTAIRVMGDMPWGAYICTFCESKVDFRDVNAACFRAGLSSNEFCILAASAPATVNEAQEFLRRKIASSDRCRVTGQIEILPACEWDLTRKQFDIERITDQSCEKLNGALSKGFDGMRVSGNAIWMNAHHFIVLVFRRGTHSCENTQCVDLTVARRSGDWQYIESPEAHRSTQLALAS